MRIEREKCTLEFYLNGRAALIDYSHLEIYKLDRSNQSKMQFESDPLRFNIRSKALRKGAI